MRIFSDDWTCSRSHFVADHVCAQRRSVSCMIWRRELGGQCNSCCHVFPCSFWKVFEMCPVPSCSNCVWVQRLSKVLWCHACSARKVCSLTGQLLFSLACRLCASLGSCFCGRHAAGRFVQLSCLFCRAILAPHRNFLLWYAAFQCVTQARSVSSEAVCVPRVLNCGHDSRLYWFCLLSFVDVF